MHSHCSAAVPTRNTCACVLQRELCDDLQHAVRCAPRLKAARPHPHPAQLGAAPCWRLPGAVQVRYWRGTPCACVLHGAWAGVRWPRGAAAPAWRLQRPAAPAAAGALRRSWRACSPSCSCGLRGSTARRPMQPRAWPALRCCSGRQCKRREQLTAQTAAASCWRGPSKCAVAPWLLPVLPCQPRRQTQRQLKRLCTGRGSPPLHTAPASAPGGVARPAAVLRASSCRAWRPQQQRMEHSRWLGGARWLQERQGRPGQPSPAGPSSGTLRQPGSCWGQAARS